MKKIYLIVILIVSKLFAGCGENYDPTPYEKGQDLALSLYVILDKEDSEKVETAKDEIRRFLDNGGDITSEIVERFSEDLAKKIDRNPIVIKRLIKRATRTMDTFEISEKKRDFLQGFVDG